MHAGAVAAGTEAHLIKVDEITDEQWATLDASDAIVFGAPTYMGSASSAFHAFAEATNKRWSAQRWDGKFAVGFTNSASKSGDKLQTLNWLQVLAGQHGMHWVNLGLKPSWSFSTSSENDLNRLGFFTGAAAQSNGDQGAEGVHKADIATAEHLGRRVAEAAKTFARGRAAAGE